MTTAKKPTYADLKRKVVELESQLVHQHHFAGHELKKCSTANLMGSAAILQITAPGGRVLVEPVAIRDGLSNETIASILNDLHRSFEVSTAFKPIK